MDATESTKPCRTCGREFARDPRYFHRHSYAPDGFRAHCRACRASEARRPLVEAQMSAPEGYKVCYKCLQPYPGTSEFFYKSSSEQDGLKHECKPCGRQIGKENYHANRERYAANYAAWYEANKEYRQEYMRQWEAENKERRAVRHKEWARENKDERNAKRKVWAGNNRDVIASFPCMAADVQREYQKRYRERNRSKYLELLRAAQHRRRARIAEAEGEHTPEELWEVLESQQHLCCYCEHLLMGDFHADHFWPLSKGGANGIENIVAACPSCNVRKQAMTPLQFLSRLGYNIAED